MQGLLCIIFRVTALKDNHKTSNALLYTDAVATLANVYKIKVQEA